MTNSSVEISVSFTWNRIGEITVDPEGKLGFPKMGTRPALYRFDFEESPGTSAYIGETDNLYRRLQHYRNPGPSQRTNQRLNEEMLKAISGGKRVFLSTISESAGIALNGDVRIVDLSLKHERVLLEHAAICEAYAHGFNILNG